MALIRTLTILTITFKRMKEKFYGFRQTVLLKQSKNPRQNFSASKESAQDVIYDLNISYAYLIALGDLREKFQDSVVSKGFFVQAGKTGTVTWEQLIAMLFPLNKL